MSRKFLTNIDLNNNLLLNPVLNSTHGASTTAGALYYSSGRLVFGNGSSTLSVATTADTVTIGSTAVTIGGSQTTFTGLSSVSSTSFVGALTGNASTATALQTARTINGVSFDGSANITVTADASTLTGTTLKSTVVNSSLTSVGTLTGLTMGGNIAMGNNKITGLGTPTSAADAVTKDYVDTVAAGINVHAAVKYATTGALGTTGNLVGGTITTTYANGTSGQGATLTIATSTNWTAITIDGQSLTVTDRVLIKNQASALQNGIYTVTSVGAIGNTTSFVFTRATDYDTLPEVHAGDLVYVIAGTTNGGDGYVETAVITAIGTDPINWTQYSGTGAVPYATTSSAGIASFPSAQFTVDAAGAVTIASLAGSVIASGTVSPTYGGTGVNNGSSTLTLAGNVSHAGSFTQTFTATGNTSLTLPTTGTLATLAGSEALTNKTVNGVTLTSATTGFTVAGGTTSKTLTVSNTLTLAGTDTSTLNIGTGGTLGSAAFTATSAYLAAGVTSLPNVTSVNGTTIPSGGVTLLNSSATGIQTFLTTPTSANLRAALTDESGTGSLVFAGGDIGAATATTPTYPDNSTKVATTAYVTSAISTGARKYTATNSSITPSSGTATWSILASTHGLGNTQALMVQMFQVSDGAMVDVDVLVDQTAGSSAPTGNVTISWNASTTVSAATYRVVIIG
jgi:hypothetical protein